MLLNKEELKTAVGVWLKKPSLGDNALDVGQCADEILTAERAKVAPHFDALPMMDSRELFMAGAEWGKAQARKADEIKNTALGAEKVARHWLESVTNRRAELLELAGKLAMATSAQSVKDKAGLYVEAAAAIIDAVDKDVAK